MIAFAEESFSAVWSQTISLSGILASLIEVLQPETTKHIVMANMNITDNKTDLWFHIAKSNYYPVIYNQANSSQITMR